MKWLRQAMMLTWLNIRTLPNRPGSSAVAIIGIAAVVGVFAGVLSMASGFERTVAGSGSEDVAIVLRDGATSETLSGISFEQTRLIAGSPGVARDEKGEPITSAELFVIVNVDRKSTDSAVNAALRGIQPGGLVVREGVEIIEGRMFEEGKYEIVVGRGAGAEFDNIDIGSTLSLGQTEWTVVGVFAAGGSVFESEMWCDARVLQPAYRRGNTFQSVRVKLQNSDSAFEEFEAALEAETRLEVDVQTERAYYAEQAEPTANFIRFVGYPVAILMAIGAIFAALNTMYSSVSSRAGEIATLRALGFGPTAIAFGTLIESAVLGLLGGLLGGGLAYVGMNARTASTMDQSFSQVVFNFAVTGDLLVQGLVAALIVGFVGGLFPAIRAARVPVASALRGL
jgi:putative ABC transport system permease protein